MVTLYLACTSPLDMFHVIYVTELTDISTIYLYPTSLELLLYNPGRGPAGGGEMIKTPTWKTL